MTGSDQPGQGDNTAASAGFEQNTTTVNRERLRTTFESAAERYHHYRPDYPGELFDTLIELTELTESDRLLEVGSGTGKATVPLARRGYEVTGIELGPELADEARRNLAGFPRARIVNAEFESWEPPEQARYDLVFAASTWHWIDPARGYRQAWRLLRPGGHLAFWSSGHVFPAGCDPFFDELQDVYDEIGEGLPPGTGFPRSGELPDGRDQVEASGLFADVDVRHFGWETRYDADAYIGLLGTFSGHIAMEPWKNERLFGEIRRRLAMRPDGLVRRHWDAVLHVARRRDKAAGDLSDA